jgi:hypothetical protein
MSELYKHAMDIDLLNEAVKSMLANSSPSRPLPELLAAQIATSFEDGLRVGLNLRCNEIVLDVPKIGNDHDVLNAINHTDGCLLSAQSVCHNVIPGIIELPDAIADYGHKCFAAGFDKGYEEGWTDGTLEGTEEEA